MGLQINKQIGTNRGLTSEAYVRIGSYEISKLGHLKLNIQIYQSKNDAFTPEGETPIFKEAFSMEIGGTFIVPLVKYKSKIVKKTIIVEEETEMKVGVYNENGEFTGEFKIEKSMQKVPKEVEEEELYPIPDLSIIEGKDVFAFGYAALKDKLSETFGAENVVDC